MMFLDSVYVKIAFLKLKLVAPSYAPYLSNKQTIKYLIDLFNVWEQFILDR